MCGRSDNVRYPIYINMQVCDSCEQDGTWVYNREDLRQKLSNNPFIGSMHNLTGRSLNDDRGSMNERLVGKLRYLGDLNTKSS